MTLDRILACNPTIISTLNLPDGRYCRYQTLVPGVQYAQPKPGCTKVLAHAVSNMNVLRFDLVVEVQGQCRREWDCVWIFWVIIDGHGEDLIKYQVEVVLAAETGDFFQGIHWLLSD